MHDTENARYNRLAKGLFGFMVSSFGVYSFRTMLRAADGCQVRSVELTDLRITRVGRSIGKTVVDELPQVTDVLKSGRGLRWGRVPKSRNMLIFMTATKGEFWALDRG